MAQPHLAKTTSAALRKVGDSPIGPDRGSVLDDVWQSDAYDIYNEVGEVGYVLNLTASTATQGMFQVQRFSEGEWQRTKGEAPVRVLNAFVGPRGNQNELKQSAVLNLGIAGEAYLVGTPAPSITGDGFGIVWEFLSVKELNVTFGSGTVYRHDEAIGGLHQLGTDVYIARLWQRHPEYSRQADSALRRLIRVAREVITLTQLVDAVAASRLNAGILFIPIEMSFAAEDSEDTDGANPDEGVNDGIDEFSEDLIEHLTAPVEDRSSAASLVPLIMRGPAEFGDKIKLIELSRDMDTWAIELRREAIIRLASGLDAPREILEGIGQTNQWSGFGVDSSYVIKHVKPKGDLLADFLTVAYLRPMLETFEDFTPAQAAEYRIVYDISQLKTALDEATNTRMVYDRGEASGKALRRSHGLTEEDAPDEIEHLANLAVQLIKAVPLLSPALLRKVPGLDDLAEEAWALLASDDPDRPAFGPSGDRDGEPRRQALPVGRKRDPGSIRERGREPTKTSGADPPATPDRTGMIVERIATAADAAVERAFERAGNRLYSKVVSRSDDLKSRLAGVDKTMALSRVAPADLAEQHITYPDLFGDAWDRFADRAKGWIRELLEDQGETGLSVDDRAALATHELIAALDAHVAANMHRPLPTFPNGLRVPDDLISQALSTVTLVVV